MTNVGRTRATLLAVLVLLGTVVAATPGVAQAAPVLGVHAHRDGRTGLQAVTDYEQKVGVDVEVANVYHGFSDTYLAPDSPSANPTEEQQLLAAGRTLMISWRATDRGESASVRADRAEELAAGQHDANLREMAQQLASLDGRVLLRFQWEMDQDPPERQHIGTPTEFIAAWRHVHDVVSAIAPDVEWVWAPRANSFNKGEGQQYWPGGAYVDHVGGSAVPRSTNGREGAWRGPERIFGSVVDFARAKDRPLLVWVGVREKTFVAGEDPDDREWSDDPTWKAGFIDELRVLAAGAWSDVLGTLVYYHSPAPFVGLDFRVDTSDASLRAMRELVCDDVFGLCGGGGSSGATTTFDDIADSPHRPSITWIAARRITRGCNPPENTRFCPGDPVTRAQMATFLHRALGLSPARERFVDVGATDTHAASIGALAAAGITRGCNPPENTRFCPGDPVTRAQMATFLHRALGLSPARERFVDVGATDTHAASIGALAAAGITRGCNPPENTRFCPGDPVTRAQMATFLHRALR